MFKHVFFFAKMHVNCCRNMDVLYRLCTSFRLCSDLAPWPTPQPTPTSLPSAEATVAETEEAIKDLKRREVSAADRAAPISGEAFRFFGFLFLPFRQANPIQINLRPFDLVDPVRSDRIRIQFRIRQTSRVLGNRFQWQNCFYKCGKRSK